MKEQASMVTDYAERPWGSWHTIDESAGYKVKRIHVKPGQRLSYQTHKHRSEHWVVIFGIATCVVDGKEVVAGPGESIDVAQGAAHRITNQHAEELVIIEVQRGAYTGEDDILRLEDDYGRCECDDDHGDGTVAIHAASASA
ncbi:phosphomannose isomerase type II C-terminal cupin domain [Nocardioides jejuensis]|nr:phosphomannose isomerase type II C-terminal cupin domain [Nocardioides jejuensis]